MTASTVYLEKYYPYAWVVLFFVSYLIFYPENWMITDSYNYVNRAIAFSQGSTSLSLIDLLSGEKINLIPAPYNTGTSAFYALIISLFGKSAIFLVPLFQVVLSVFLLSKTLERNHFSNLALSILALSLSLMFFSRSMMSCMPSFLIISGACYLFFRNKITINVAVGLGSLFTFSLWFRESNVFLIAPFVIHVISKNKRLFLPVSVGLFLGLCPKLMLDKLVYGTYWFSSASSGFSASALLDHVPEYSIILTVLIPLSILFIASYKGKADKSIKVSSAAFVLLYLFYNYSAVDFSGLLKGSFLTSRFMVPLLPIVVVCAGEWLNRNERFYKFFVVLGFMGLAVIPISQYAFHNLYEGHENAAKEVSAVVTNKLVIADYSGYTNTIRYFNPLTSDCEKIASIQNITSGPKPDNYFVLLSRSEASAEKQMRADSMASLIEGVDLELMKRIEIDGEGNWLEVYEGKKK